MRFEDVGIWPDLRCAVGREAHRFVEKDSRQINFPEQILVAKVFNFGGICSAAPDYIALI